MDTATARWQVLAILFTARTAMAFQFQVVGALSPLFTSTYGIGLADIGLLVGLYSAPGIIIALPGGSLAARFGDKRVLVFACALMVVGGVVALIAETAGGQMAARVIAGVGGIAINVIGAKVVSDWFEGHEIGTAMSIYITSWPVGIALALMVLPLIAALGGLGAALATATAFAALGLVLLVALYRPHPQLAAGIVAAEWPQGRHCSALVAAAFVWAFANTALIVVFTFGPALMTERGLPLVAASGMTSLSLWLLALVAPFGGIIADRTGQRDGVILCGLSVFAAGLVIVRFGLPPVPGFALIGIGAGLCAGPIMSIPATILRPATRALGMGMFYALYYLLTLIGPAMAGWLAATAKSAAISFDAGIGLVGLCVPLLLAIRALTNRQPKRLPS